MSFTVWPDLSDRASSEAAGRDTIFKVLNATHEITNLKNLSQLLMSIPFPLLALSKVHASEMS